MAYSATGLKVEKHELFMMTLLKCKTSCSAYIVHKASWTFFFLIKKVLKVSHCISLHLSFNLVFPYVAINQLFMMRILQKFINLEFFPIKRIHPLVIDT